jgi:hypothetical protein
MIPMHQVRQYVLTASMSGLLWRRLVMSTLNALHAHRIEAYSNGLSVHQRGLSAFSVIADLRISSSIGKLAAPVALLTAGDVDQKQLDGLNNWFPPRH